MDKQQSRVLRPLTVSLVSDINERVKRIFLTGASVAFFQEALPAAWVKVFFTAPGEPEGPGRAYTISNICQANNLLALDFVQHGDGPAVRWSQSARPGEVIRIAGPRGGVSVEGLKSVLVFGDETAIPGIFAILKALDKNAVVKAFITKEKKARYTLPEVFASLSVTWLNNDDELAHYVCASAREDTPDMVWGAGEHSEVISIRKHLFHTPGRSRKNTQITAYWKSGEADHRDSSV